MSDPQLSDSASAEPGGDPSEPYRAPTELSGSGVKAGGLASPGCWILVILVVVVFSTLAIAMATYTASFGLRRGPRPNFQQQIEDFGDNRNGVEEPFDDGAEAPAADNSSSAADTSVEGEPLSGGDPSSDPDSAETVSE